MQEQPFLVGKTIFKDIKTLPHNFGNNFREAETRVTSWWDLYQILSPSLIR